MSLSSKIFSPFFHVYEPSHMTCNHGQRVQGEEQGGVLHSAWCSLAPSIITPLEELPAAAAQCSAGAFLTPSGHKAVSLIIVHLEYSPLMDLLLSALYPWAF